MGTITSRKRKDNSTAYTAQIRINRDGKTVYQESQTFDRKQVAQAWIKRRETELAEPGAIERANRKGVTIKKMIEQYLEEYEKIRPLGKTKSAMLNAIKDTWLGELDDSALTSQKLVEFAQWRMSKEGGGVLAQTVGNDLSHLGAVLSVARPAWGYEVDPLAMPDARRVLRKLGMVSKSSERNRRPTLEELDALMEHFFEMQKRRPDSIHMPKVIAFAIFSTRRQEEITRIRWEDLDQTRQAVLVRDMKNPGQKIGNNVWCHLPDEAWAILHTMPKVAREIFPYNGKSVSASFTRACHFLEIDDLHFHDLRHDGVSRLFEMDWDIPRVSSVSGHRDWNSLRRYTHLRGRGDAYKAWGNAMSLTEQQLQRIMPNARRQAGVFVSALNAAMLRRQINTPQRQAAFLAQVGHESGQQQYVRELGGDQYLSKYDTGTLAVKLGNTPEADGDGQRYRGRGLIQITGRNNYLRCSLALFGDERLLRTPELLELPQWAAESAAWFWWVRELNTLADQHEFEAITRKIDGGLNGLEDRLQLWARARAVLCVSSI